MSQLVVFTLLDMCLRVLFHDSGWAQKRYLYLHKAPVENLANHRGGVGKKGRSGRDDVPLVALMARALKREISAPVELEETTCVRALAMV